MRVAHLLRKYEPAEWGGTETVVLRLLTSLRDQGVNSTVHAPRLPRDPADDPLADAGFPVRRFGAVVPVWGISAEQRQQMLTLGGNLISFELMGTLWREPGLDVVHSHALGRLGGIGLTVARRRRIPFVVTVHGGVYDLPVAVRRDMRTPRSGGWEWGKLFGLFVRSRQLLDEADAVITCNPREAALIRENHPRQRVLVQPHGVDLPMYRTDHRAAALAAFPWLEGARNLLSVTRISSVKNPAWLVERMPALLRREPRTQLVIVGATNEPDYGAAMERRIAELGLGERVRLVGGLPAGDPRLIGLMQVARAMVLPSLSETFGMVILEAWAAGTPILASRTSGARSLITCGVNGALFDLNRPLAFNEVAFTAMNDDSWRAAVVAGGSERVTREYTTAAIATQVKSTYEELIEERNTLRRSA